MTNSRILRNLQAKAIKAKCCATYTSQHNAIRLTHRGFHMSANAASKLAVSPSRSYSTPRHLLSIADISASELKILIENARKNKVNIKSGVIPPNLQGSLTGKTVAMLFSKRSTRTRVSTEGAVSALGGHAMFLGSSDIQQGVNESLQDTSRVISSMSAAIVARVGHHSEVEDLAKWSAVPVINALSNNFHPFQTIADFLTIKEAFSPIATISSGGGDLSGLKIAWIGDSNNVLFDLALGAVKLGVNISVASPDGYGIPTPMRELINSANIYGAKFEETNVPEEAIKGANILVTDTWVSMGQEQEAEKRRRLFSGFQITAELAQRGGADPNWKFMHCLPRHKEEVDDDIFYGSRSLVFPEAENRLWSAVSVLEGFVVNKGVIA